MECRGSLAKTCRKLSNQRCFLIGRVFKSLSVGILPSVHPGLCLSSLTPTQSENPRLSQAKKPRHLEQPFKQEAYRENCGSYPNSTPIKKDVSLFPVPSKCLDCFFMGRIKWNSQLHLPFNSWTGGMSKLGDLFDIPFGRRRKAAQVSGKGVCC